MIARCEPRDDELDLLAGQYGQLRAEGDDQNRKPARVGQGALTPAAASLPRKVIDQLLDSSNL